MALAMRLIILSHLESVELLLRGVENAVELV